MPVLLRNTLPYLRKTVLSGPWQKCGCVWSKLLKHESTVGWGEGSDRPMVRGGTPPYYRGRKPIGRVFRSSCFVKAICGKGH
jgi:hypothetical protein